MRNLLQSDGKLRRRVGGSRQSGSPPFAVLGMPGSLGTVPRTLFLLLLAPGWLVPWAPVDIGQESEIQTVTRTCCTGGSSRCSTHAFQKVQQKRFYVNMKQEEHSQFFLPAEPQACMFPCQCPSQPLQCPAGTSHVWDACGCCKVCAQQLGELCSLHRPCDHHKGLYCDFSKIHRGSGICLAHEGATCDLLGKIYLNGESFQPTCKLQCICVDGAIGCIPLCSDDLRLPSPECPTPRRVKFHNRCCEEWVCEEDSEDNRFGTATAVFRKDPAHRPELNNLQENCLVQTTEWSTCSRSCGMGISTRVTNKNPQCHLEKETRLCMVRPCDFSMEKTKKGKKCVQTPKQRQSLHFEFSGCTSTRSYRPRFCGSCSDGRCCTPFLTSTVDVEFRCPEGDFFQRKMMFIKMCSCHYDCPRDNDIFLATYHRWMIGDHVKVEQQ